MKALAAVCKLERGLNPHPDTVTGEGSSEAAGAAGQAAVGKGHASTACTLHSTRLLGNQPEHWSGGCTGFELAPHPRQRVEHQNCGSSIPECEYILEAEPLMRIQMQLECVPKLVLEEKLVLKNQHIPVPELNIVVLILYILCFNSRQT